MYPSLENSTTPIAIQLGTNPICGFCGTQGHSRSICRHKVRDKHSGIIRHSHPNWGALSSENETPRIAMAKQRIMADKLIIHPSPKQTPCCQTQQQNSNGNTPTEKGILQIEPEDIREQNPILLAIRKTPYIYIVQS